MEALFFWDRQYSQEICHESVFKMNAISQLFDLPHRHASSHKKAWFYIS